MATSSNVCYDRSSVRNNDCSKGGTAVRSRTCDDGRSCSWSTSDRSYWANSSGRGETSCDVGNVETRTGGSDSNGCSDSADRGCCRTACDCGTRRTRRFRLGAIQISARVCSENRRKIGENSRGEDTKSRVLHPAKPHRCGETKRLCYTRAAFKSSVSDLDEQLHQKISHVYKLSVTG